MSEFDLEQCYPGLITLLLSYHFALKSGATTKHLGQQVKACAWRLRSDTKCPETFQLMDKIAKGLNSKVVAMIKLVDQQISNEFLATQQRK